MIRERPLLPVITLERDDALPTELTTTDHPGLYTLDDPTLTPTALPGLYLIGTE